MLRCATAAVLAVLASVPFASAADKAEKAKKPTGAWTRTANDHTVTFTFDADSLTCDLVNTNGEEIVVHAAYGATDDGLVFGVITKVEKKGTDNGPDKGDLFSFTVKTDKDTLTIGDLNGSHGKSEQASQLLEGEYKPKKAK
jgi:hypothetical protein